MKKSTAVYLLLFCFTLLFAACSKELSLENGSSVNGAVGSLHDTLGNCLPDSVYGTYYDGVTPGSDTAYVQMQVDVQTTGYYSIYSDLQNGLQFADSGFFTATGINTIRLKPIGTPILIQSTLFTVTFDSTSCNFSVDVKDSTGTGLGNNNGGGGGSDSTNLSDTAWKFSDGTQSFNGPIDTAYIINKLGATYLTIVGPTLTTGDTAMSMDIILPAGSITTGTYLTSQLNDWYFVAFDPVAQNYSNVYIADVTTTSVGEITITIVSYDSSTGIVTGTFSGTAQDSSGNPVTITNGSFKAKIT